MTVLGILCIVLAVEVLIGLLALIPSPLDGMDWLGYVVAIHAIILVFVTIVGLMCLGVWLISL